MTDSEIKLLAKLMVYMSGRGIVFSYKRTHTEIETSMVVAEFILKQEDS